MHRDKSLQLKEAPFRAGFSCLSGTGVRYQLIRSSRRTLSLEVTPEGAVIVRAPDQMPDRSVERFVAGRSDWIEKHLSHLKPRPEAFSAEEEAWHRIEARRHLPELISRYGRHLGVSPATVRVTGARKRFGSCSARGGVCFSFRLFAYPREAVEYVVAHELAHLRHLNHSPAFHRLLGAVMPDYRQRAALLKQPAEEYFRNGMGGK